MLALQRTAGNQAVGRALQRVAWAMSKDAEPEVKVLASATRGWFQNPEPSGPFGNTSLDQDTSDAITLWGHTGGHNDKFGGMTAEDLVKNLVAFGLERSKHTTVNLISCACNATESSNVQTYAQALQDALGGVKTLGRTITVRALPMAPEGHDSVLYSHNELQKVAYVIAPAGKLNDVDLIWKTAWGMGSAGDAITPAVAWSNFVSAVGKRGYTAKELSYSSLVKSLEPVVKTRYFKGEPSDKTELLLPNVYGGK
jgi:hypothetical protein